MSARRGSSRLAALLHLPLRDVQPHLDAVLLEWLAQRGSRLLTGPNKSWHSGDIPIGTGGVLMGFFRDLLTQWVLDIEGIPDEERATLADLAGHTRAENTLRNYETCWRMILGLCARWKREPLPMDLATAMSIVGTMAEHKYSMSYIAMVRGAIRAAHRFIKAPDPTLDPRFQAIFYAVECRLGYARPNAKTPLFLDQLLEISQRLKAQGTLDAIQTRAILLIIYWSMQRRETIVAMRWEHLSRWLETQWRIWIPRSKNDQRGRGHEVYLDPCSLEPLLDPVLALDEWLAITGITSGFLFRHLGPLGTLTEEPLAARTLTRWVQREAQLSGLDPKLFGAQSPRAAGITESLLSGVPDVRVAQQSGHRDINSLGIYFRPGNRRPNLTEGVVHAQRARLAGALRGPRADHGAPETVPL